jgi:hypothetical protein
VTPLVMTAAIERQIERFAPGLGATILARHAMRPVDLSRYNSNYVGGDINGAQPEEFLVTDLELLTGPVLGSCSFVFSAPLDLTLIGHRSTVPPCEPGHLPRLSR